MGVYDYHREKLKGGTEPVRLYGKRPEITEGNPYKVYVAVTAVFTQDGQLLPQSLTWENGRRYEIDHIRDVQRMASRKAGGAGICYFCSIEGQEIQLFYEENGLWFVTRKYPAGRE